MSPTVASAEPACAPIAKPAAKPAARVWPAVILYACLLAVTLGVVELLPKPGGDVAVLATPWSPAAAAGAVARADGTLVSGTRWPFIVIARPTSRRFIAAAYAQGAWLVFDPGVLAGCRTPGASAHQD